MHMHMHMHIQASGSLRQTGLQEAVIDLFVCAAATDGFMGSNGSSAPRFLSRPRTLSSPTLAITLSPIRTPILTQSVTVIGTLACC